MKRVLLTLLFLVLPVLLVVWQVCFADTTSWYLVAAVLLLLSALPFFLLFQLPVIPAFFPPPVFADLLISLW